MPTIAGQEGSKKHQDDDTWLRDIITSAACVL
jgi:hypothetical protein